MKYSISSIDQSPSKTVDEAVQSGLAVFKRGLWSKAPAQEKFHIMLKIAALLRSKLPELTKIEVLQTGRPIREMQIQLQRIPEWIEYFASIARTNEGSCPPFSGQMLNVVKRNPLGVVGQITSLYHRNTYD